MCGARLGAAVRAGSWKHAAPLRARRKQIVRDISGMRARRICRGNRGPIANHEIAEGGPTKLTTPCGRHAGRAADAACAVAHGE